MSEATIPEFRVKPRGKGFGVQAKWPRSGPWSRTLWFPRWVWHGPFGITSYRWSDRGGAEVFAAVCRELCDQQLARPPRARAIAERGEGA